MSDWTKLAGIAVQFLGSQEAFKKEANILKRLVGRFGPLEVERMIQGAKMLGFKSLVGLNSADGLGRRLALAKFWESENKRPTRGSLESLAATLKSRGF
jgi:hypothetical protein